MEINNRKKIINGLRRGITYKTVDVDPTISGYYFLRYSSGYLELRHECGHITILGALFLETAYYWLDNARNII